MAKKKYYVVWQGKEIGIFDNWDECKNSVSGFKGAQYKSFASLDEAKKAFGENYNDHKGQKSVEPTLSQNQIALMGKPILNSISVDAACSGVPGTMEYRGVETKTKQVIFQEGPYEQSTNNVGEFLALVHALKYMKKAGDKRPIYSDSKTAMAWVRNKNAKTKLERTPQNYDSFHAIEQAINWLKNNSYTNRILKWETKAWGEIPADFGRK